MKSFIEWLAVRETLDFNMLLHEARTESRESVKPIPDFKIAKRLSIDTSRYQDISVKNIHGHAMEQYKKELAEQMRKKKKGIGNPNRVFATSIRHQLTNYDAVWQAIEENQRIGNISRCKSLSLLVELWKQMKLTANTILANMPNYWMLPNEEDATTAPEIKAIMDNDMNVKIGRDESEMLRLQCGEQTESPPIPSAVIRPNLQKSAVDTAIDDALEGKVGKLNITGNKNAIQEKLKTIKRKASEKRLTVNFNSSTGEVQITGIGV